jgi:hypothetical protein
MDQPPHIQQAIEHLDVYGYCVLPGLLPTDWCADFAAGCLRLHADEMCRPDIEGDGTSAPGAAPANRRRWPWRGISSATPAVSWRPVPSRRGRGRRRKWRTSTQREISAVCLMCRG